MKINASAGRSKKSLLDHCEKLEFSTKDADDAELLASIYAVIVFGGRMTIDKGSGLPREYVFERENNRHG